MAMFKRIFLFLVINFLVVMTISIVLSIFNIQSYISQHGINILDLAIYCLVFGMGGAFISLALSRIMAKWMLGVKLIDPKTATTEQKHLFVLVKQLAEKAHLPQTPQVGIYKSAEVNAFATGPTKKRSLVAVSSGLLENMNKEQLEGVLAHEITHVSNGDMVTMTLLQGIVNAFVMFLARVLAMILSGFGRGDRKGSYGSFVFFTIIFQIVFMVLGSLVVFWFSRKREFRADSGGAHLAGKTKMIHALEGLKTYVNKKVPTAAKESLQTFKISTPPKKSAWANLFASHPPLDVRIAALKGEK